MQRCRVRRRRRCSRGGCARRGRRRRPHRCRSTAPGGGPRSVGLALEIEVERGVDAQPARPAAVPRQAAARADLHVHHKVRRLDVQQPSDIAAAGAPFPRLAPWSSSQRPHLKPYCKLAPLRRRRVEQRVVAGGILHQPGEQRGFLLCSTALSVLQRKFAPPPPIEGKVAIVGLVGDRAPAVICPSGARAGRPATLRGARDSWSDSVRRRP